MNKKYLKNKNQEKPFDNSYLLPKTLKTAQQDVVELYYTLGVAYALVAVIIGLIIGAIIGTLSLINFMLLPLLVLTFGLIGLTHLEIEHKKYVFNKLYAKYNSKLVYDLCYKKYEEELNCKK